MNSEIQSYSNLLALVGNTPLIRLNRIVENFKGNFFAKWEAYNPGHSNKDRIALHIIEEAEKKGSFIKTPLLLKPPLETLDLA